MLIMDSPPAIVESLAEIWNMTSICQIYKTVSDDEAGDFIEIQCGLVKKNLGRALKGVSVDRIQACQVALIINNVHVPQLINVSICNGNLSILNIGETWVEEIQKSTGIGSDAIEFVTFEKSIASQGCYDVTVTYDKNPGTQNTSYEYKEAQFCIEIMKE